MLHMSVNLQGRRGRGLTDDEGNVSVSGGHNQATGKVPRRELRIGDVCGGDSQQDCPSNDADNEYAGDRDTTGLLAIGEGGEEKHDHKRDDVWGDCV